MSAWVSEFLRQTDVIEALSSMPGGAVFAVDADNVVVYWSASAEREFGQKAEEVVGHHCAHTVRCATCLTGCVMTRGACDGTVDLHSPRGSARYERRLIPRIDENGGFGGGIEILRPAGEGIAVPADQASRHADPVVAHALDQLEARGSHRAPVHVAAPHALHDLLVRAAHGRSAAAPSFHPAAELDVSGLRALADRARTDDSVHGPATVVVEGVESLPASLESRLIATLDAFYERAMLRGPAPLLVTTSALPLDRHVARGQISAALARVLEVGAVTVPPLGERQEDIETTVWGVLRRLAAHGRRKVTSVEKPALARLLAHDWPGDITELKAVLARAYHAGSGPTLLASELPAVDGARAARELDVATAREQADSLREALREADGNATRAAEALGISRSTLWRWRRKYGV